MSDPDDPERYGPIEKPPHWCELCRGHTGPNSPCYETRSQKMADAGYTRRPRQIPPEDAPIILREVIAELAAGARIVVGDDNSYELQHPGTPIPGHMLTHELVRGGWVEGTPNGGSYRLTEAGRLAYMRSTDELGTGELVPPAAGVAGTDPSNAVQVDRGALQMALNVLRRAGKNEVADALAAGVTGTPATDTEDSKAEAIAAALMRFAGYAKDEARACSRLILSRAYADAASSVMASDGSKAE